MTLDHNPNKNIHLVVLVHGLWGNVNHMNYLATELESYFKLVEGEKASHRNEELLIYKASNNEGYKTYDGIDVCGLRVANEIKNIVNGTVGKVTKFSIIGYSLGGLICRFAIGLLYKDHFFEDNDIDLINFTTFCSPHVGVLAPGTNVAVSFFNTLVPIVLGNSGKQIFLKDKMSLSGSMPLVYVMSMKNSVFYKALQKFKYRSLYANVINDKRTAWWTSGISKNDPFFDLNERSDIAKFQYIKGYNPIIIDAEAPINVSDAVNDTDISATNVQVDDEILTEFYFIDYWASKLTKWVTVLLNLLILAPLWLVWFFVYGTLEAFKSTIRVTLVVNKYSQYIVENLLEENDTLAIVTNPINDKIVGDEYSSDEDEEENTLCACTSRSTMASALSSTDIQTNIENSLTDKTDTLLDSVFEAIERKNTVTGLIVPNKTDFKISIKSLELLSINEIIEKRKLNKYGACLLENFRLNISKMQLEIIENLNDLEWKKFPVFIRNTKSSHACAIVRHDDPDFEEGECVVRHWVSEVFKLD